MTAAVLTLSLVASACTAGPAVTPATTPTLAASTPGPTPPANGPVSSVVPMGSPAPTASPSPASSPGPSPTVPADACLTYLAAEEVAATVGEPILPDPTGVSQTTGILECEYELADGSSPAMLLIVRTDQQPGILLREADALPRTSTLVGIGIDARYSTMAADPDLVAVRGEHVFFEIQTLTGEAIGRVPMADLARLILPRLPGGTTP